ncbi:cytochrome c [Xanthobacter sp. KR7-65]|uniref:cytochrome c n=1 Tax=Xanthobacter sp. KR7-65 TaxID=3156612 RepID=UPI0032B4ADED
MGIVSVVGATSPVVAEGVISQRKAVMKRLEDQTEIGAAMLKGHMPYDPAKAAAIFAAYRDELAGYAGLFPAGSDRGDTNAAPAVWSDRAGYEAAIPAVNTAVVDNAAKAGTADGFKMALVAGPIPAAPATRATRCADAELCGLHRPESLSTRRRRLCRERGHSAGRGRSASLPPSKPA